MDDDDHEDPCRSLALLMKTDITEAFYGDTPESSVTCILASIYDVDEEEDIIYANTEDTAFLERLDGTIASEAPGGFLDKVVELCEFQLGLVEASETEIEAPPTLAPGDTNISKSQSNIPLNFVDASESRPPKVEVHVAEGPTERDELLAKMRNLLSENEELRTARVRARDEDGRLAVDKDGMHYLFDGVEISEDQKWCLD